MHLSLLTQMNEPEQEELIKNEFDVESSSPLSPKSNSPTFSSNDRKTQEYQNIDILSVELGDVILIHAPRNRNIDQQSYYIYYIDDLKLKLLNPSTNQLLQLNIDG